MISVNFSSLKLIKTQDTKIVIDYKDNSQVLPQSTKTPAKFVAKSQGSNDLAFSYRIFDQNSLMLASNEVNISKAMLFFNPNTLNTHDILKFVSKNKFQECELVLDTAIVLSENHIKTIENTRNEINSKIENPIGAKNQTPDNIENENISKKKFSLSVLLRDFFSIICLNCYRSQSST